MFIDIHVRAYWKHPPLWVQFCTPEQVIERYDKAGIEKGSPAPHRQSGDLSSAVKRGYPGHGGLNALLYSEPEKLWAEMRRIVPVLKQNGGYVIISDHSVPDSVSLKQFAEFVRLACELGNF